MRHIYIICVLLVSMIAFPQCTEAKLKPEQMKEIDPIVERYCDAAPEVDPQQHYQLPVDTRIALAGSYGELRPNHFHGGLDFKTDQTIGHPVYSFADGFIRRAAINAYGYGYCLYVEHPGMGLTSVYGHLDTFSKKIWAKFRERQVSEQLNNADITFAPDELPVTRGEVIALSGNTGSSGGPHVHFELRNIPDDDNDICYDPQMFFLRELKDTQAPKISHVYLYPQQGQGVANGSTQRQVSPVTGKCATQGGEGGQLTKPFTAWGKIGIGLKAYDYMDGQANKYGLKELRLYEEVPYAEGEKGKPRYQLIYRFRQDAFRFSETRYTNSLTDYAAFVSDKSMIMKSFIEPGNLLQQVDASLGNGIVDINEERAYHFVYEMEDAHGNLTSLDFNVQGVRSDIPAAPVPLAGDIFVEALKPTLADTAGFHLAVPSGTFYTDQYLAFSISDKAMGTRKVSQRVKNKKGKLVTVERSESYEIPCISKVYNVGSVLVPMHSYCEISIDLPDSIEHAEQLYLTNLDESGAVNGSSFEKGGLSRPASMNGRIRTGGRFAVRRDSNAPKLSILKADWKRMQIDVSDAESGVARFRVLIDGKFVPFNMDNKGRYFGEPNNYGIVANKNHQIEITAWDNCGNQSTLTENKTF